jgi:hypothetical protein
MQDNERAQKMSDTYGHTLLKQLASYDQNTLSWKTSEDISASDLRKFSATLPKMGTMLNGVLYEQVMSVRHTREQDYSLLPTPTAMHVRNHDEPIEKYQQRVQDFKEGKTLGKPGASTGVAVRLIATPTTNISHTTGKCRNWGADLLHDVKCLCKPRRIHWSMVN